MKPDVMHSHTRYIMKVARTSYLRKRCPLLVKQNLFLKCIRLKTVGSEIMNIKLSKEMLTQFLGSAGCATFDK